MKRDHYIIPICSLSTSILDAICYLTQLTKFVLQFVWFILRQQKKIKPERVAHYSLRSFCFIVKPDLNQKRLYIISINQTHGSSQLLN